MICLIGSKCIHISRDCIHGNKYILLPLPDIWLINGKPHTLCFFFLQQYSMDIECPLPFPLSLPLLPSLLVHDTYPIRYFMS